MLSDFKKRESLFDKELQEKEDKIRKLQSINMSNSKDMNETSTKWNGIEK